MTEHIPSMIEKIKEDPWRWYGNVLRMPENRPPKQTKKWNAEGSRRRGRLKVTWRRTVQREMRLKNLTKDEISSLAEDRSAWGSLVADPWTS